MSKQPPSGEQNFVFSDDEDDDDVVGGGIPDSDGWIHLEGKQDGVRPREGNPRKRKAASRQKLVRRSARRPPKGNR